MLSRLHAPMLAAVWLSQGIMRPAAVMENGMGNQQNHLSLVRGKEECGGEIAKDTDKQQFSTS